MSERQTIEQVLRQARRRRRLQRSLNGLAEGTVVGVGVFLLILAAYKLLPIPSLSVRIAAGVAAVCAVAGLLFRGWRSESLVQTARWVDQRGQLKERLSTALEVADQRAPEDWKRLVLTDAATHARSLNVGQLSRLVFPRLARWALLLAVLTAGLGFVPEYRTKAHAQRQQEAAVIRDAGRNLAEITRRDLAQKPPVLPGIQKSIEEVAELGDQLGRQKLTKAEALKDLTSLTEKLARQEQQIDQTPGFKRIEQAARQPGNGASSTPEALQKQMDALQKSLGDAAGKRDQLEKLSRDLQKLQQQAANTAGNDGKSGEAARQQLAQSLAALAQQAKEAGASLDGLEQAIEALQSNNIDQFVKDLDLAAHDLDQLREMAKSMQQLQQQLTKMGKDLGEQLKYGQAQAAIQTLEKMMDQLKAANLSPEQLQKILDELKSAAGPAEEYGKVAEHLKQAAQQGQKGDKTEAAKNLAAAQEELKKLLEQMEDSEGLQAALASLERAQMAVSSGTMWSQVSPGGKCSSCNGSGCARCNGTGRKWGHGGKPGQGVGTWADEYGWTYFDQPQQAGWDNSGIQRPDMDPKGLTDRPTDLNPNLIPDKAKGRMSPGGSMPSITLKGVSIKGTSNVKFEEAATAAQAEAQSALNQDQVPRTYQNAVRDYFDDLKR